MQLVNRITKDEKALSLVAWLTRRCAQGVAPRRTRQRAYLDIARHSARGRRVVAFGIPREWRNWQTHQT